MSEKHRWGHPREWLEWAIREHGYTAFEILDACNPDGDTIQDAFQDDMAEDGYFGPDQDGEDAR